MAGFLGGLAAEDKAQEPEPYRVDFIEETGIDLILLDVEVYDEDGRPIHGLNKEDFTLKINARVQTIYSVDDLCSCSDTATDEQLVADAVDAVPEQAAGQPPVPVEPMLYILYLNFGQLDWDGRVNALAEAGRWIREVMQPGEQAQIVAWTSITGLEKLTGATDDKEELLAALRKVENNPEFNDPFPALRWKRQRDCAECYSRCANLISVEQMVCIKHCQIMCTSLAREEYSHCSWSMDALQQMLYSLEQVRGRKTVLYFFKNDTLVPSRLFVGVPDDDVRDLRGEIEQVGADAVLSRTAITAAYSGSGSGGSGVNFGANLADFSGGSYNRVADLLPEVTGKAGRGCRCIYRIGVKPPPMRRDGLYHATAYVHDRKIPRGLRLQHLTRFDRWLRAARAVLLSPEDTTDVPVTASLHPMGIEKGRWNLMVRVAVDTEGLFLLPAAGGKAGSWETGALIYREPGTDPRELLASSRLTVEDRASGALIVHERILEGIRPGEWYMGSFVRDRNAKAFGGSATTMVLPKPGEGGLSIPVPFLSGQPWIRTGLPDLTKKKKKIEDENRSREILLEPFPLPNRPMKRGSGLEFRSWVCSPKKGKGDEVIRYVARDGEPIFRFETVQPPEKGSCIELVDPVDTRFLEPGEYTYHIRYLPEGLPEPLAEETVFLLE